LLIPYRIYEELSENMSRDYNFSSVTVIAGVTEVFFLFFDVGFTVLKNKM
jgi:hypothetical protein